MKNNKKIIKTKLKKTFWLGHHILFFSILYLLFNLTKMYLQNMLTRAA